MLNSNWNMKFVVGKKSNTQKQTLGSFSIKGPNQFIMLGINWNIAFLTFVFCAKNKDNKEIPELGQKTYKFIAILLKGVLLWEFESFTSRTKKIWLYKYRI